MSRLATNANPWTWRPGVERKPILPEPVLKPGVIDGILHLGAGITAETSITRSHHADAAYAGLVLIPADRDSCPAAWSLATTVLGSLVTNDMNYCSPMLPAPDPATLTTPATE
ncbi:hypothetical protein [Streptomyces sp. NBC_00557]|uniref:hypothetical protein n=1 Tax=Streptomyces sp. NBC_00557 TaxID=2975776 RepID=UPI002E80EF4C|nr:hypothetical protein [Streptomyces sp. NBC_00557]WUC39654.1 hypothetical protein OG956_38500 [Streptomyces sp. NBC_00557]